MQPSLNKPPMSGDETTPAPGATLPPLSPELPARDAEAAAPITETPPKDKAEVGRILLPKALVDDLYRESRKNFALIPDMTFALAAGSRALRDIWEHKDGKFTRKERPFANYIPPKDDESGATLTKPKTDTETPAVAEARARWDEAKREGDPDRMTRTANDLLRAKESEQLQTEQQDRPSASSSVGSVLAPQQSAESASEDGANSGAQRAVQSPGSHDKPIADSAAKTITAAHSDGADPVNPRGSGESSLFRLASNEADDDARWGWGTMFDWLSEDAPEEQFGTAHVKPDVHPDAPTAGLRRIRLARHRARHTGRPPERAGRRSHWADPNMGWSEPEMRETLVQAATRPLTAEDLLTWSSWVYPDEHRDREGKPVLPHALDVQGWRVIDWIDDESSGYYGMAVYNPRTNEVVLVSRGTEFNRDAIHRADEAAAIDIFEGKVTRQLQLSHSLLKRVWKAFRLVAKKPRYYATGHSLGGAAAQFQVAAGYADPELKGMQIYGVTFAAVGANDAIHSMASERGPWRRPGWIHLDRIASDRVRNYVRVGDGFVMQRTGRRRRPGRFGGDRLMAGLHMEEIESAERTPWESRRDPWVSRQMRQGSLEWNYFDNHSLKSYYSSDFVKPVDQLFDHVWDHYVQ